jgi:hypothetical protein
LHAADRLAPQAAGDAEGRCHDGHGHQDDGEPGGEVSPADATLKIGMEGMGDDGERQRRQERAGQQVAG